MSGGFNRWAAAAVAVAAVLVAVGIAAGAYQAGVTHRLALQIPAGTTPPAVPYGWYGWYGWHRPWGFGFGPIFFILIWFLLLRGIFWGGPRRWYYRSWDEVPPRFDDWHRRAHEQMKHDSSSPTNV